MKNVLAAILGVLLACSIGGNAWLYSNKSKGQNSMKELAEVTLLRDSLIKKLKLTEDSLTRIVMVAQDERLQLTSKIEELEGPNNPKIAALQQRIASIRGSITQTAAPIQSIVNSGGKVSKEDAEKIASLKKDLESKLKEIEDLNAQIVKLTGERDGAYTERDDAVSRKAQLELDNADMKERMARGALPQYGTLLSTGIAKKGDQQVETNKIKGVEKIKITFDVLDNPLIKDPVEEEITIRIIGPEGDVLSTNNAKLADVSAVYSLKQTIISDGEMHKVKWYYPQSGKIDAKLKKGRYTTELWARGLLKQKNTFELN